MMLAFVPKSVWCFDKYNVQPSWDDRTSGNVLVSTSDN